MERLTEQVMVRLTPLQRKRARMFAQEMSELMNRRVSESEVIRYAIDVFLFENLTDGKPKGGDDRK